MYEGIHFHRMPIQLALTRCRTKRGRRKDLSACAGKQNNEQGADGGNSHNWLFDVEPLIYKTEGLNSVLCQLLHRFIYGMYWKLACPIVANVYGCLSTNGFFILLERQLTHTLTTLRNRKG